MAKKVQLKRAPLLALCPSCHKEECLRFDGHQEVPAPLWKQFGQYILLYSCPYCHTTLSGRSVIQLQQQVR